MVLISIIYKKGSIDDLTMANLKKMTAGTVASLSLGDTSVLVLEKHSTPNDELMFLMVDLGRNKDVEVAFSNTHDFDGDKLEVGV